MGSYFIPDPPEGQNATTGLAIATERAVVPSDTRGRTQLRCRTTTSTPSNPRGSSSRDQEAASGAVRCQRIEIGLQDGAPRFESTARLFRDVLPAHPRLCLLERRALLFEVGAHEGCRVAPREQTETGVFYVADQLRQRGRVIRPALRHRHHRAGQR